MKKIIEKSNVHLGINVKKSISGLKSYLKTLVRLSDYYENKEGGEIVETEENGNKSRNYQFLNE